MAKVSFRVENAPVETIQVKPTWADLSKPKIAALIGGQRWEWGVRIPLATCPKPKKGASIVVHYLDGRTQRTHIVDILYPGPDFAYVLVDGGRSGRGSYVSREEVEDEDDDDPDIDMIDADLRWDGQ